MTGQDKDNSVFLDNLDTDWVNLIMMARELGISKEIVRAFLAGKMPEVISFKEQL